MKLGVFGTGVVGQTIGWKTIVDLGDLSGARGVEAYVLFWLRLYGATKSPSFNVKLVR